MSDKSGLAAVHAAADAISRTDHDAAVQNARAEGRAEGETAGRAAGRTEGASAERARILGIEANALPGHEQLVATMKADASVTADMAAGRILAAERALRGSAAQAIRDVETATGVVAAAPASAPAAALPSKASTPEGWKAEHAASAELQGEFASADAYVAYQQGLANGTVRRLSVKAG
jgi:hypothetical protein